MAVLSRKPRTGLDHSPGYGVRPHGAKGQEPTEETVLNFPSPSAPTLPSSSAGHTW